MTDLKCPICSNTSIRIQTTKGDENEYDCKICGTFLITDSAEATLKNKPYDYRLSAWIREYKEYGREHPKITTYLLDEILKNLPNYKPSEKQLILLRSTERRTSYLGKGVHLNPETDYPLAWAVNPSEFNYLIDALIKRNFVSRLSKGTEYFIEPDGWDYLDKYSSLPAFTNQAFVAMSFDKELDPVWENGIKPAVEKAGYKPHRVDKEPHIDRIDAKIIADIKDSKFVIADVTQQKQGVYFEAGYALGLKLPVIWCIKEDDLKNVHFDTRQYNHIVWKTPDDLQERLYEVICAVIGKGTQKQ